jgi:hypothetical protein
MFFIGNGACCLSLMVLTALYFVLDREGDGLSDSKFALFQWFIVVFVFAFVIAFSMSLGPGFWAYIHLRDTTANGNGTGCPAELAFACTIVCLKSFTIEHSSFRYR